jgi:hypothetical protein
MQKPEEMVFAYLAQNIETFKCFLASKLDDMPQATAANANHKNTYDISGKNIAAFVKQQMFTTGLHEPIQK